MSEANYPAPIRILLVPTMRRLVQEIINQDLYARFQHNLRATQQIVNQDLARFQNQLTQSKKASTPCH